VKINPVVQHGYKCKQACTVGLEINSAPDMSSMGFVYTRTGRRFQTSMQHGDII